MKKVLIVGNGISRLAYTDRINAFKGEVWACNYAFREFPRVKRLIGHVEPMREAVALREKGELDCIIYAAPIGPREGAALTCPPAFYRDSGSTLVAEALHSGYAAEVVGFDFGGPDVYAENHHLLGKRNWVERWVEIHKTYGLDRVTFWGYDHKPHILAVAEGRELSRKYEMSYKRRRPHIQDPEYLAIWEKKMGGLKLPEDMVRVRYRSNGLESDMKLSIAEIMVRRGSVDILTAKAIPKEGNSHDENNQNAAPAAPDAGIHGERSVRVEAGSGSDEKPGIKSKTGKKRGSRK